MAHRKQPTCQYHQRQGAAPAFDSRPPQYSAPQQLDNFMWHPCKFQEVSRANCQVMSGVSIDSPLSINITVWLSTGASWSSPFCDRCMDVTEPLCICGMDSSSGAWGRHAFIPSQHGWTSGGMPNWHERLQLLIHCQSHTGAAMANAFQDMLEVFGLTKKSWLSMLTMQAQMTHR